jgi:hypothetical protein
LAAEEGSDGVPAKAMKIKEFVAKEREWIKLDFCNLVYS